MKPEPTAAQATTRTTVEYQVQFMTGPKGRKRVRAAGEAGAPVAKAVPAPPLVSPPRSAAPVAPTPHVIAVLTSEALPSAPASRVPKITLLLVLGHHFEQLVRDGVMRDYAEIARQTGLSRARVTQIANLTLLAPEIQSWILYGKVRLRTESHIRRVCSAHAWESQGIRWETGDQDSVDFLLPQQ
jgi:hypothetical protein